MALALPACGPKPTGPPTNEPVADDDFLNVRLVVAQYYCHIETREEHVLATSDGEHVNPYRLCKLEHVIARPDYVLAVDLMTQRPARYCSLCRGYRPPHMQ